MDKVMKTKVVKILEELAKEYDHIELLAYNKEPIVKATSSLTALIIKWLEGKKAVVIEHYYGNSENTSNIGRNQLITELIGELNG